jgi:hypothetical protein
MNASPELNVLHIAYILVTRSVEVKWFVKHKIVLNYAF